MENSSYSAVYEGRSLYFVLYKKNGAVWKQDLLQALDIAVGFPRDPTPDGGTERKKTFSYSCNERLSQNLTINCVNSRHGQSQGQLV